MKTAALPKSPARLLGIRFLIGLLAVVLVLAAAGAIYQAAGAARDRRAFLPPGQKIDVGGYQLHLFCQGEGSPTVVIEALSGGSSSYYPYIQSALAEHTRVCSYDRAGRAWSEPRPSAAADPLHQTALELHTLLKNGDISGPLVLAGHSIGGIYARKYADLYPEQVAGLVLIDSAHPKQFELYPEFVQELESYLDQSTSFPVFARLGLFRLYFTLGGELDFQALPERQHAEVAALWSSPEYFLSQRQENLDAPLIYQNAQTLGDLGDLPLVVISAPVTAHVPAWPMLQAELAGLSTNSAHRIIENATHVSLAFDPEHAAQVAEAILEVVETTKTGQPVKGE